MTEQTMQSVVRERTLPYPSASVWRALVEPSLISQWLYESDFRPVVGHRFQFRGKPRPHWNGIVDSEVLTVEPERRVSYTWNAADNGQGRGLRTTVTWTLTAGGSGTHVRVEQSGFRSDEEAKGPSSGWDRLLHSLERVVANSNVPPAPQATEPES